MMRFGGKVLGLVLGLFFGGFFGALLGLFIGHFFDRARSISAFSRGYYSGNSAERAQRQEIFLTETFAVMGHMAKSKGQVTRQDINLVTQVMKKMGLTPEQSERMKGAFRQGKEVDFSLDEALDKVRQITFGRHDLLQFFLHAQISLAFADGSLSPIERQILHHIASRLGLSVSELDRILMMQEAAYRFQQQGFQGYSSGQGSHQQQGYGFNAQEQLKAACDLLGVQEGDDAKTIKRAHRKLMNEHHPDKLIAKGLPPEMMEMAKQKTQEIQNAYEIIKKVKGFK